MPREGSPSPAARSNPALELRERPRVAHQRSGNGRPRPAGPPPRKPLSVALLGSFPPRECGIATFTRDLHAAVEAAGQRLAGVVAIDEPGAGRVYGPDVRWRLDQADEHSYRLVAEQLNATADVLCIQHEYGLYGGTQGEYLLTLIDALDIPVVTTLHTTVGAPSPDLLRVTRGLCERSAGVVVLARAAIPLLRDAYGVTESKMHFIPHGIPTVTRSTGLRRASKARLGLSGRTLLTTFGLIGPGKGIQYVIQALPEVVKAHADLLYLVLGETHPGERRATGETYRESLEALVADLGLEDNVAFDARYLSQEQLIRRLLATDVYLMPYLNPEQIVSGTLAYAVGCGKAVIATDFRYARELLANGRGEIVGFRDPAAITQKLIGLLGNRDALGRVERRAYESSRSMQWPEVAREYRALFAAVATRVDRQRSA